MLTVQSIFLTRDGYHILSFALYTTGTYVSTCVASVQSSSRACIFLRDDKFLENLVNPCETTNPLSRVKKTEMYHTAGNLTFEIPRTIVS